MAAGGLTRRERHARRVEEIVDVAAVLFAENGYAATGVAELCDAVGLGRGALYNYIGSKERLLSRIHARFADVLIPQGRAIVESDASPVDKLRAFGEATIRCIVEHPDHVWVFMHERTGLTGEVRDELHRHLRDFEAQLAAILEEGRARGVFVYDDLRLAMLAWFGMHNYTYQWLRAEPGVEASVVAAAFYDIFARGLVAPDLATEAAQE